jgi:hypothetical protein
MAHTIKGDDVPRSLAMSRPTLLPHLRPLWRGRTTLQLGTDPAGAVVVEFRDPGAARLLGLLDGRRTETQVAAIAGRHGIPAEQTVAVLGTLRAAGVLACADSLLPRGVPGPVRERLRGEVAALALGRHRNPAQALRRRSVARILVTGPGPLVAPLATALATAGVGRVAPEGPWRAAAVHAIGLFAPEVETARLRPDEATFAVISGTPGAGHQIPGALRRAVPYLPVVIRDTAVVVGPLTASPDSACPNCLDLHRCDRDPGWPALAAQLATAPDDRPCPATTVLAGAAYAAEEVLAHLDGRPPGTRGATVEISGPGRHRTRRWPVHPRCPCRPGGRSGRNSTPPAPTADCGTRRAAKAR